MVYRATDVKTGAEVAAKALAVGRHQVDRAEVGCMREARVLRELRHPGIPAFVDAFVERHTTWVVQEYVDGENLAEEARHHRYTEAEVLALLDALSGVLEYLHGLSPPVVHRDIKPSNVIRRPDGSVALVDFGSVRDRVDDGLSRSNTAAGTFGYMAPEQLRGEATPASDLYALGALAVWLLTREEPATLLDWNHRLRWRSHAVVRPETAALVDRMIEADPRRRPASVVALREMLRRRADRGPRGRQALVVAICIGAALAIGSPWRSGRSPATS